MPDRPELRPTQEPAGHVFVSYASQDAAAAQKVCAAVESSEQRCWIAPRDVHAGDFYASAIIEAINSCRMLVLLLSRNAIESPHVLREVERACSKRHQVLTVRLDETLMPTQLEYFLSANQWLDGSGGGIDAILPALVAAVNGRVTPPHTATMSGAVRSGLVRDRGARANWTVILGGVLAALGAVYLLVHQFWPVRDQARTTAAAQSAGAAGSTGVNPTPPTVARAQAEGNTFAVLPFVNLTADPKQEYFSDGLTEEITSALARIPNLRVVGRTSAFQFKGQNKDMRDIGQALHARYLLEGSVRMAGNRLRVTAQLIESGDGTHLWTESYDRRLADVFAIQEEIAQAIAVALRVPLGLKQGETLITSRAVDPASYQDYLRARALYRSAVFGNSSKTIALLQRVVKQSPDFAPAWALLARAQTVETGRTAAARSGSMEAARRAAASGYRQLETAAQTAVRLDPKLPEGYVALGRLQIRNSKLPEAEDLYLKALALDPECPDALALESNLLGMVGRLDESLAMDRRTLALEPFIPTFLQNGATLEWVGGDPDKAFSMASGLARDNAGRGEIMANIYAAQGRFTEAADALHEIPAQSFLPGTVEAAEQLLRSAAARAPSPRLPAQLGRLGFVFLYAGAPVRALEFNEEAVDAGNLAAIAIVPLWHPAYAPARRTERFKTLMRKTGLLDYWRARGWPAFCHAIGTDDFACS